MEKYLLHFDQISGDLTSADLAMDNEHENEKWNGKNERMKEGKKQHINWQVSRPL